MTPHDFRKMALSFAGAVESSHMQHPDFRVHNKIFATLAAPDRDHGMVKLTPDQQQWFMAADSDTFAPAAGGWGRAGCTYVQLASAKKSLVREALEAAYNNIAAAGRSKKPPPKRGTKRPPKSRP